MDVKELYEKKDDYMGKEVTLQGWIKNHRKQKEFGFLDISDGTDFRNVQIVYDNELENFEEITKYAIGCAVTIIGKMIPSNGKQDFEIKLTEIKKEGDCDKDYPLQPKRHSNEFLREIAYLRPRANLLRAVFRIRSVAAHAIHTYFQDRGYVYVNTPLLTANDGEGAGEMFKVTTLDLKNIPKNEDGSINYKKDFFGKKVGLTVTGQLEGEAFAMAFKKIYTFGPAFRAENSNTKTHVSELWMVEPEIAFCNLEELMDIEEDMLKYIVKTVLEKCPNEIEFFENYVEHGLKEKLQTLLEKKAVRITHENAIKILKESNKNFEYEPEYNEDLAKEHEKYLTEEHFHSPVFVTDWPKDIKAFYMKENEDGKTVAAVDLLVPGSGELMGGSQREENYEKLAKRMKNLGISEEGLEWYLNLRKYGGCIHSGFGMGFERLLMYITGISNIRDVIPFPRTPNNCDF